MSLKALKKRIKTVGSIKKITKAMEMVAASKLKKARLRSEAAKPYAEKMQEIIENMASHDESLGVSLLSGTGRSDTVLFVVYTSDRGLCGPFNNAILKLVRTDISIAQSDNQKVKILCIGKKGYESLNRKYYEMIVEYPKELNAKSILFEEMQEIGDFIINMFYAEQFDICKLYFNRFKSTMSQVPDVHQIIPIRKNQAQTYNFKYEVEPDASTVLQSLLPNNIAMQIYAAMLESVASEYGARMTAMDNATRNSSDMIERLNLTYNRTRQACITKELIEIISGAEAI